MYTWEEAGGLKHCVIISLRLSAIWNNSISLGQDSLSQVSCYLLLRALYLMPFYHTYWSARVAITKHHRLGGLYNRDLSSQFWRWEVWDQGVGQVDSLWEPYEGRICSKPLSLAYRYWHFPWVITLSVQEMSLSKFPFLLRYQAHWVRTTLKTCFKLITFLKILSLNTVTFWGHGG